MLISSYSHNTVFDKKIEFEPDMVVVAYGTNDWNHYQTLEEGRMHFSQFLDRLVERYGDKKLFGISPIWRDNYEKDPAMGSFESCCDYVKEEIKKHNMILIEGESLVPPLPEFFIEDVLHPNTSGFGICIESDYADETILDYEESKMTDLRSVTFFSM